MKLRLPALLLPGILAACGVSTQQEIELGQQTQQQIAAELPLVRDQEINRYINVLGDSIAKLTPRADLPWTFYVVDSRDVNAFAVPGGFIYVNRGLIERAPQLTHLAGVLGHKIGHVVERHSVEQMEKANTANMGATLACTLTSVCNSGVAQAVLNVGGNALFAKFTRDDEREADQVAIENVVRARISPKGVPAMFQILLNERQSNPGALDNFFATHPAEESRIRETQAAIDRLGADATRGLTEDSQAYQNFRRRLASLPAPPAVRR